MKITFTPKTHLGKWTVGLIIAFFIFLAVFFIFIQLGERGGETLFSNLKLFVPYSIAALSAVASFFTGLITTFKNKERSVLVFLCMVVGFLVLLWILAELVFPH